MTTRTTVLPAPIDIQVPDSVIQEWLNNWNKGNSEPVDLESLDDITYDFIYRAIDYAANLELAKCLFYLRTTDAKQEKDLISALLAYRRPKDEDSTQEELMKEIEELKEFMMIKITKLKNKISATKIRGQDHG